MNTKELLEDYVKVLLYVASLSVTFPVKLSVNTQGLVKNVLENAVIPSGEGRVPCELSPGRASYPSGNPIRFEPSWFPSRGQGVRPGMVANLNKILTDYTFHVSPQCLSKLDHLQVSQTDLLILMCKFVVDKTGEHTADQAFLDYLYQQQAFLPSDLAKLLGRGHPLANAFQPPFQPHNSPSSSHGSPTGFPNNEPTTGSTGPDTSNAGPTAPTTSIPRTEQPPITDPPTPTTLTQSDTTLCPLTSQPANTPVTLTEWHTFTLWSHRLQSRSQANHMKNMKSRASERAARAGRSNHPDVISDADKRELCNAIAGKRVKPCSWTVQDFVKLHAESGMLGGRGLWSWRGSLGVRG